MIAKPIWALLLGLSIPVVAAAPSPGTAPPAAIEAYVSPYVQTRNFSGVIAVAKDGRVAFAKAYGFADQERRTPNTLRTRFHVASMSMQFTAAAALRLIQSGQLSLNTPVSAVVVDFPGGSGITIRHLLTQTSGIADINDLPDYDTVLKAHQTPLSLVDKVRNLPRERAPGTYKREEHSAYNLLALVIERKTGQPFAKAVSQLVFEPLHMRDSGIDDDSAAAKRNAARGYAPKGLLEVAPAEPLFWSAKTGSGSAYTTAADELKFAEGLFDDRFLSAGLRKEMFDPSARVGYGWFKSRSDRFGQLVYSMNGRAPGFASAVVYIPAERLFVTALSNIYASVPTDMAYDIGALMLNRTYQPISLKRTTDAASLAGLPASFRFPADFYQPSALVRVSPDGGALSLHWPSGDVSNLIPVSTDHYIDRSYWIGVEVVRDKTGKPVQLKYDRFTGVLEGGDERG